MKYLSILIVCAFLLGCTNNSTEEKSAAVEATNVEPGTDNSNLDTKVAKVKKVGMDLDNIAAESDPIKDIRQKFNAINTAKGNGELMMDSIVYECPDYPNYGTVYYYKKDDKVQLIKHSFSDGAHGGRSIEYYLWDNELFFEFIDENYWTFDTNNSSDGTMSNTVDYYTEMRYYFSKGELIKCLEKKFEYKTANKRNPTSNEVSNKEVECKGAELLLKDFYELRELPERNLKEGDCIWELDED
ncbi:MAG: hypothetical protein ACI94Y_001553 [Maribacter sp.]|jgi:hypothetical protein